MSDLQTRAPRFLRWLHDDQAGYIEIVAGVVLDPERPDKIILLQPTRDNPDRINTRQWFYLDPERPDLYTAAGDYAAQLSASYGNVYTGIRTCRTKKRAEENVKPGRVIFIDDAPAAPELAYSASIRTSEHSRHAYYKCAQNVTKDDARRAAAALGGDPSGVDLTQLVRIPGTLNTKNGCRWPVEPESVSNTIYNLDVLRGAWPAIKCNPKGEITPLNMPQVEHHLSNIAALLASTRAQLIKPSTQTGRILAGEMLTFLVEGQLDDSRSMNASAVAIGLLLRGFSDDEISAIVFHLYRKWEVELDKGTEWCKADIARLLAYAHTKHPEAKQSPTRYRQQAAGAPIVSTPARSRARADRPRLFDPAMLFARYQAQPDLCGLKRKARAAELHISTATLDRLEDGLEALGLIEIQSEPGMPGRVILLGGVINISADEVVSAPGVINISADEVVSAPGVINIPADEVLSAPIAAPSLDAPMSRSESEQSTDRVLQCKGGTHPPPETPSPSDLARRFFASAVDPLTGEVWERHTFARFKRFAAVYGSCDMPTLSCAFAAEQKRSRYERRDVADSKKARAMGLAALQRTSRSLSTQAAAVMQALRTGVQPSDVLEYQVDYADGSTSKILKTKMPTTLTEKYAKLLLHRAGIYAAEESRREQAEQERIERAGYTLVEQAEMLALVDASRPKTPRVGRTTIRGVVCSPHPCAPAGAAQAGLVDVGAVELLPGKRGSSTHRQDAHVLPAPPPATDRHRAPIQAAAGHGPQPGSAGYSIDGVQYADQRIVWRVWDDGRDQVISECATEADALAIANQLIEPELHSRAFGAKAVY
jgi:hypothetical protein